ncbi:unnamed protein product [Adineta steineri]|uniref:Uncharacterized protein n=1 Tax=Adineta steineri TaxID=433720 RepID=A0A815C1A7_9BILA|nr:unnamed protein product [Adineta steineri]CAF3541046.1 unnamed protein product [Adineta steineri]
MTTSFSRDDFNSLINELENTMQRSQILVSQTNHINTLQTKQIDQSQMTMDKSSQHLRNVEREVDELEKNFCVRLCCSSKTKKSKLKKSDEYQLNENIIPIEPNPIYSNQQFQNLDENLQRLQYFNTLIDNEIQDQLQTLSNLNNQVNVDTNKLTKTNYKSKRLF